LVDQVLGGNKWGRKKERDLEPWEKDAFIKICEASIKKDDKTCIGYEDHVRWFLGFIGLMSWENHEHDWIPTPRLLELAAAARARKQKKYKK
jgi:hypothetical protein